eukprot:m.48115 g.48115  ORF g.48115 m.48115 type:complete len:522 (+) comp7378_c0_seq2:184-1749(+)
MDDILRGFRDSLVGNEDDGEGEPSVFNQGRTSKETQRLGGSEYELGERHKLEDLQREVSALQKETREKTRVMERLRLELEDVKEHNEELTSLRPKATATELARLKREFASLTDTNNNLLDKIQALEKEKGNQDITISNLQLMNELTDSLQETIAERDRAHKEDSSKIAQQREDDVRRKLNEMQRAQAEDYREHTFTLQQALDDEKRNTRQLQEEMGRVQMTMEQLHIENDRLVETNEDLTRRIQLVQRIQAEVSKSPRVLTPSRRVRTTSSPYMEDSNRAYELGEKLEASKAKVKQLRSKLSKSVEAGLSIQLEVERLKEDVSDFHSLLTLSNPADIASLLHDLKIKFASSETKSLSTSATQLTSILRSAPFLDWADINVALMHLESVYSDVERNRDTVIIMLLEAARTTRTPSHAERAHVLQRLERLQRRSTPAPILDALDDLLKIERRLARTKQRQDEIEERDAKALGKKKKNKIFRPYKYDASNANSILCDRLYDLEELAAKVASKRRQDRKKLEQKK